MKPTTRKRYERIRQAAAHMYGTMPVMHLYAALAHDFDLSEERIRKILAKNAPPKARLVVLTNKTAKNVGIFAPDFEKNTTL